MFFLIFFAVFTTVRGIPLPGDDRAVVEIIKQVNTRNDDGSYTFGYESADGSFKVETRDPEGNVKGRFGYLDESGNMKLVEYSTDVDGGFVAQGQHLPIQSSPHAGALTSISRSSLPKESMQDEPEQAADNLNEVVAAEAGSRELNEQILPEEFQASHVQALQSLFEERLDEKDVLLLEKQVEKQQKVALQETPSLPPSAGRQ